MFSKLPIADFVLGLKNRRDERHKDIRFRE